MLAGARFTVISVGLVLLCCLSSAHADEYSLDYYSRCINRKIAQCDLKTRLVTSQGENLSRYGVDALRQATYYRDVRGLLVAQMIKEEMGRDRHRINYFLIKAYAEWKKHERIAAF